jgi:hypothetical protein
MSPPIPVTKDKVQQMLGAGKKHASIAFIEKKESYSSMLG